MKAAPVLDNEAARLAALRAYAILDTAADPSFDALTELASEICATPISIISLVDSERQWFKSVRGLDCAETPRDISFCGHVVAEGGSLCVEDTVRDSRFADNPLVTGEPQIRFYAGEPITTPDGMHLGTICVIDRVPRRLSEKQHRALRLLSKAVLSHMELHRNLILRSELQSALDRSNDDLTTFMRAASHDLRAPLRSILLMVAALQRDPNLNAADRESLLEAIRGSAQRGHRLVDDLLRHTRVQLLDNQSPVDLEGAVQGVRDDLYELIAEHKAQIHTSGLPCVSGSPTAWHLILKNLIENAIKYTPADRAVNVFVQGDVVDQELQVRVHDTGCGIEPKYIDRIFQPLERLHGSDISGSGIGLTTVKKVVSLLGGTVTVCQRDPIGSTFTVSVPYSGRNATQS